DSCHPFLHSMCCHRAVFKSVVVVLHTSSESLKILMGCAQTFAPAHEHKTATGTSNTHNFVCYGFVLRYRSVAALQNVGATHCPQFLRFRNQSACRNGFVLDIIMLELLPIPPDMNPTHS